MSSSSRSSSRASTRPPSHPYQSPSTPFNIQPEAPFPLESTLHNISIDPATMDDPDEGMIFESIHPSEMGDICSKLVVNLVRTANHYCQACSLFLNPTNEELSNFVANGERDFNSHHQCINHIDSILAHDARHRVQLGCPIISVLRYFPTTAQLCTLMISEVIENIKEDLGYFKEDL